MTENKIPFDENGEKHGLWELYYNNSKLNCKGWYIHGKEYGYWECYDFNGRLINKESYIHGCKYGLWEKYWDNGELIYKHYYRGKEVIYVTLNNKLIK